MKILNKLNPNPLTKSQARHHAAAEPPGGFGRGSMCAVRRAAAEIVDSALRGGSLPRSETAPSLHGASRRRGGSKPRASAHCLQQAHAGWRRREAWAPLTIRPRVPHRCCGAASHWPPGPLPAQQRCRLSLSRPPVEMESAVLVVPLWPEPATARRS
jgi:hypothetical protein